MGRPATGRKPKKLDPPRDTPGRCNYSPVKGKRIVAIDETGHRIEAEYSGGFVVIRRESRGEYEITAHPASKWAELRRQVADGTLDEVPDA